MKHRPVVLANLKSRPDLDDRYKVIIVQSWLDPCVLAVGIG